MLPGEHKPWAKPLAKTVIVASILAAIVGAWYLYDIGQLYIPEITGIVLLLLTIIPPNVVILRQSPRSQSETPVSLHRPQPRVP